MLKYSILKQMPFLLKKRQKCKKKKERLNNLYKSNFTFLMDSNERALSNTNG